MKPNNPSWVKDHQIQGKMGALLLLHVQPGAAKIGVKGVVGESPSRLKIGVHAPPLEGAANSEVIQWLSKQLKIAKSKIFILSGEHAKQKNIWIEGLSGSFVANSLL